MAEKKRVSSLSRGFGISVIATGEKQQTIKSGLPRIQTNVPGSNNIDDLEADFSIVSQSTISDITTNTNDSNIDNTNQNSNVSLGTNTSGSVNGSVHNDNTVNGTKANGSVIDDSDDNVNSANTTDTQIDVSISSTKLRRKSFNRLKKIKSNNQLNNQVNGKPLNKTNIHQNQTQNPNNYPSNLPMSQRFKSTPSFHSPPPSMVTSPIINSKSNTSSPYLNQSRRSQHNLHSYSINNSSNIRLSRRRSCQQLTKKQKDKLYDDDKDTFDDTDADVFMYNVPIASSASLRLFQNSNALKSTEVLRKAWNESESNIIIPPSPLPGKLSDPATVSNFTTHHDEIPLPTATGLTSSSEPTTRNNSSMPTTTSSSSSAPNSAPNSNTLPRTPVTNTFHAFESPSLMKNPSFNALSPTAKQLSTFYEYSSHNEAEEELKKRKEQPTPTTLDPNLVSVIDDLSLASAEKLSKLSVTRPSWIPPKSETELHRHEKEFKKMIERTSKEALKNSKHQLKIQQERTIGDARLKHLSGKEFLTSSNCSEVRKYIIITDISPSIKFKLFSKMIIHKLGDQVLLIPPFQKQDSSDNSFVEKLEKLNINSLVESVHKKPNETEISSLETILQPIARPVPSNKVDVNRLPKIPALPIQTLLSRLAKIALTLLRCNYSTPQVRDIIYWLHAHILTVKFKEEFTKLLTKHSISKQFKEFKDDYSILTVPTSFDLLLDLDDIFICKCIELLIVFWSLGNSRGPRIFIAIVVCLIRDYHFGWNNLQVIFHSKAHVYVGNGEENEEKFFDRVINHYGLIK